MSKLLTSVLALALVGCAPPQTEPEPVEIVQKSVKVRKNDVPVTDLVFLRCDGAREEW